jgi:hypothetical protein
VGGRGRSPGRRRFKQRKEGALGGRRGVGRKKEAPTGGAMLTDKRRIPLQSASVRTHTFFTTGFPRFLSIRGARGLQAFDLPLLTSYSNPNYDYTRKRLNYTREND